MVADSVFIDTNVLVYASRPAAPEFGTAVSAVDRLRGQQRPLCISAQVLREYLAVVTRPQATTAGTPMPRAMANANAFRRRFLLLQETSDTMDRLFDLLANHPTAGRQVHDANLVATMLSNGITTLLTFNTRDFRRFEDVIRLEAP